MKEESKKLLEYVTTQLKRGKFTHWDEDKLEIDSPLLSHIIDENENIIEYYTYLLTVGVKRSVKMGS